MQRSEGNQRRTIFQSSHRVTGHYRGGDDGGSGKKQSGVGGGAFRVSKSDDGERRYDANQSGEDKICAEDLAKRHLGRLSQDQQVREDIGNLHYGPRNRRNSDPAQAS